MHINYRRGETRVSVGLRDGGVCASRIKHRRKSFAWEKAASWAERREAERTALCRDDEMPRWRPSIRWDWL